MSLKQISSLTLVALCLAACGGGGGGGGSGSRNNLNAPNGNDSSSNKTPNTPDFSVPKLIKVSELQQDAEEELDNHFSSPTKISSYAIKIGEKTYTHGNIDFATLGNGLKRVDVTETATANINGQNHKVTRTSKLHLYQQPYSIVTFTRVTGGQVGNLGKIEKDEFDSYYTLGQSTKTLPSAGSFNYKGVAFNENERGNLDYTINFDTKMGSGSISGLNETGKITLHESNIVKRDYDTEEFSHYGVVEGKATLEKQGNATYDLGIFGPNANEIAGIVTKGDKDLVGFGGQKQ